MSQPGMQPRWASLEDLTPLAAAVWNWPPTRVWMAVIPGLSSGRAHGHDPVGHHDAHHRAHRRTGHRSWSDRQHARVPGLLAVRARAARHRWPGGGCSGLDNTVASQQGRRVGLSRPVGRAMDLPVDESTSPATQGLQQALQQGAGGRLRLDLGGFW